MKTLDDFVKDILRDKKKQKDLDFGNVLEKILGGNWLVTGPLSNRWTAVELARLSQKDSLDDDLKEIQEFVEQKCIAAGKSVEFHVLLQNVLHTVGKANSSQQSKQMKTQNSEQKNSKSLLGKKFREKLRHISKSKKQTLDMLSNTSRIP